MELCKKNLETQAQAEVTDQQVSEFNIGLLNSHIGDSIDMFLEDMLNESAQTRNFTSGDSQVLSVLNKFRAILNQIGSSSELINLLRDVTERIRSINSPYVGPKILDKLIQLSDEVYKQSQGGDIRVSMKNVIRAIFFSEAQLNPRLEVDPSQSMPIGGFPSGETLEDPVVEDKTMAVPTNVHVDDASKANFQKIYTTLSQLVDLMDDTSHPSTALFGRLRRDLGKAENSAWSLLYQLKNSQG